MDANLIRGGEKMEKKEQPIIIKGILIGTDDDGVSPAIYCYCKCADQTCISKFNKTPQELADKFSAVALGIEIMCVQHGSTEVKLDL